MSTAHKAIAATAATAPLTPAATQYVARATETLRTEADAVNAWATALQAPDSPQAAALVAAVSLLMACKGRVVVSGIGKSAHIAQKFAATLNSTGTPALFLHAAEAIHGDLGMVQPADAVVMLSQSGASPEIRVLASLIQAAGNPLIAVTGGGESPLALAATVLLHTPLTREACPLGLAPTTSTTLHLALTDALAMCLLEARGFTPADFARYHPGGALGKQLYLRVETLAAPNARPQVAPTATLQQVVLSITEARLGATAVVEGGALLGIITDGDLRRTLERHGSNLARLARLTATDLMTPAPKTITATALAVDARAMLRAYAITQLPVVDAQGQFAGFVHLHDLLREGIV